MEALWLIPPKRQFHQLEWSWPRFFFFFFFGYADAGILMVNYSYLQKGQTDNQWNMLCFIKRKYYGQAPWETQTKFFCFTSTIRQLTRLSSVIAMAAINDCGFDLIQYPTYCLFPKYQFSVR